MSVTDKPSNAEISIDSLDQLQTAQRPAEALAARGLSRDAVVWTLFGLGALAFYFADLRSASVLWSTDEMYQHGWFIFPIAAFLVWWRRDEIRTAARRPEPLGLLILSLGIGAGIAAYTMKIPDVGMWSILPTLAGAVIALHGRALWKIVGFAICFLIFAGPLPGSQVSTVSGYVQRISTTGAAVTSSTLGYPLVQRGNYIDLPQATLEVADVCSGFKKLTSFIAFGCLWAYLFPIAAWRRAALVACAVPISILANIVRISGLIAVTSAGGVVALNRAHNPAEYVVLALGFGAFVLVGKWLGCDRVRF